MRVGRSKMHGISVKVASRVKVFVTFGPVHTALLERSWTPITANMRRHREIQ